MTVSLVNSSIARKSFEEERITLLLRANSLLSSQNYFDAIKNIASLLTDSFCECFIIDVYNENGTWERILSAHSNSSLVFQVKDINLSSSNREVLEMRRLVFACESELTLGLKSRISVPLMVRDKFLGVASFLSTHKIDRFTYPDLEIAEILTSSLSLGLENHKLLGLANRAINSRDEFLSNASHELRTPITPLKLQTQMLRKLFEKYVGSSNPRSEFADFERMMNITDKQIRRLSKLIEELLDASRINLGELDLHKEKLDLREIVYDVIQNFTTEFDKARCPITLNMVSVVGNWDRHRIEQVVFNMLANSISYGAAKPIEITICKRERTAILRIRDYGIGIAKEDHARIFKRYERAVSSHHYSGLGLGLYISNQIIEAHEGKIDLESELGKGATFTIELPLDSSNSQKSKLW